MQGITVDDTDSKQDQADKEDDASKVLSLRSLVH